MNRRFLDDEQLDRKEQFKVLKEIFAVDLRKILLIRIRKALNKKMPRKGVLEKIAAISSRTHGDARKAVELLSKSAQIAE
ncbi:MAG: hypothetical protein JW882_19805, partial [Deltaproteobacteria bacterium]|nr:hypothetical protein [Deltaproteobacteria bacterium]